MTWRRNHQQRAWLRPVAALAALALGVVSCAGGSTPRETAVTAVAAEALTSYFLLNAYAEGLVESIDELCAAPDLVDESSVAAAEEAIMRTRRMWSYTAAMQIESVKERRSWAVMDWPISQDDITSLLLDDSKDLTSERIGNRVGADQRGLGAAEYLLSLHATPEPPPNSGTAQRRCEYMSSVAGAMLEETELILGDTEFIVEDDEPLYKLIAPDAEMGVDRIVNDTIFLLEAITDMELGRALGETSAEARLDAIVEGPMGLGAEDLRHHLDGLRAVYLGANVKVTSDAGETSGLHTLLDDELVSRLTGQFDDARAALEQIDGPLLDAVQDDPATVSDARAALKVLQVTISTEVVAHLGVTIGFSDADGDSSA